MLVYMKKFRIYFVVSKKGVLLPTEINYSTKQNSNK